MFPIVEVIERLVGVRREGSDTHDVEAKKAAGGVPSSIATTLSAFANTPGGGDLILGLDEARGFAPVTIDAAALKKSVASIARQALTPPVVVEFEKVSFERKGILVVHVSEAPTSAKPCIVRRTGRAYLRSWDGDFELSDVEVQGFLVNCTQPRFDAQPVDGAAVSDLAMELVSEYVATARLTDRGLARITDDRQLLRKSGVVTAMGVPTVAGLLALGEYPQQWFPNYVIQVAASPEHGAPANTRIGDVARFSGPIPQMIDDALAWVGSQSRRRIIDAPGGRVRDQYDFPPVAVRELLSNALVHRDLAEWSWSRAIELRVNDTELRLVNPGGLYGLSVSRLFDNQITSARNLSLIRICQYVTLRDGRVVEALATGMAKIFAATVDEGLPPPHLFDQSVSFTARLTRPHGLGSGRHRVDDQPANEATPAERRVLAAIPEAGISQRQLAQDLAMGTPVVSKHLRSLRAKGLVTILGGPGQRDTTYRRA